MKYFINLSFMVLCCFLFSHCKKALEVLPDSELSNEFLATKKGAIALLNSAYDNSQWTADQGTQKIFSEEGTTDIFINFRGAQNLLLQPFQVFAIQADNKILLDDWQKAYRSIRDANILLSIINENHELSSVEKAQMTGEAKFMRGLSYSLLYGWFGTVPLIKTPFTGPTEDFNLPRAEEGEFLNFIETDLASSAEALPLKATETGRATKGAAWGVLTKFYLNTKNWVKAASTAKQIIDLGQYKLWPDYSTLFALNNEGNSEMIFVFPCIALEGQGNNWPASAFPPLYPTTLFKTATQACMPVAYYKTFDTSDKRKNLILTSYTNNQGNFVSLLTGVEYQNPRCFKYPIDAKADNRFHGDDIPFIRYADILLSRAEALVMSSSIVSQEALDLLNQVHIRAGLNALTLTDVPTKDIFINLIMKERGWEFYCEGKRREDLIRQGKFIQNALDRGLPAKAFHVLFPIPQSEIDANPNLKQNQGY